MRVDKLIEALSKHPPDANARAYEGFAMLQEPSGIIVEREKYGETLEVIFAHESEPDE